MSNEKAKERDFAEFDLETCQSNYEYAFRKTFSVTFSLANKHTRTIPFPDDIKGDVRERGGHT